MKKIKKPILVDLTNYNSEPSRLDNMTDAEFMDTIISIGIPVPDEVINDFVDDPNNQYSGASTLFGPPYTTNPEQEIIDVFLKRRRK